jgi:hypothetical protein
MYVYAYALVCRLCIYVCMFMRMRSCVDMYLVNSDCGWQKSAKVLVAGRLHVYVCMYVCMYACMYVDCGWQRSAKVLVAGRLHMYVCMYVCLCVCVSV